MPRRATATRARHASHAIRARALGALVALAVLGLGARAGAQPLGRAADTGRARAGDPRPAAVPLRCSTERGGCVHLVGDARTRVDAERATRALERALAAAELLGLPLPPGDGAAGEVGPAGSFDLYLDAAAPRGSARLGPADPCAATDVAAPFAIAPTPDASCRFEHEVTRAVGAAVAVGLDAAQSDVVADMYGGLFAALVEPCTGSEIAAVAARAAAPDAGIFGPEPDPAFLSYLADAFGRGDPVGVPTALMATAAQRAPSGATRYRDEPDLFDALRASLAVRGKTFDGALLDFAVARAFEGSRSDGVHLDDTERFGDFARVRFDWVVPFATLPRRLGPRDHLRASGSSYLWLDVSQAAEHHLQAFFTWDEGRVFRWTLVRVDAEGRELGRLDAPGVYGADGVHLSMADFQGAAGILVVGVHVGSDDRSAPLDPDDPVEPGAAYLVTLYEHDEK
ncbi:MAG: hypothetical protein IT373_09955 [Polyangiaceae bacterium]|nr:hypothetical protein [Polyangiaceae bacterium]